MDESPLGPRSLIDETAALRAGRPAPGEYVDRFLARLEHLDPLIHAFVPEPGRAERLHAQVREAAGRGPLHGAVVGIKDIVHVDGLPTHAGSALPPGVLAGPQAAVVDRLLAAGALVAGKTTTAEFAATAPGPTRNPHHPGHTPGGSSSGSAAAVAAGLVPLAVGTQTVGSVIRPAAYCGVVGFRPTYGRIPTAGVIPNAPSFDTLGVFTADLPSAALAASLVCDDWQAAGPVPRPVLGVPRGPYLERAEPEALRAFEGWLARLEAAGLEVRRVELFPDFAEIARQLQVVNRFELARSHADWFARFGGLYRPETAASIRVGQGVAAEDRTAALHARERLRERVAERTAAEGVDLWLAPSATGGAPEGLHTTGDGVMSLPWSHLGLPALSLPAGRTADGLPLGLQVVGARGRDELLLAQAADPASVLV
ncbi:amidase [Kitasatospora sp. NPDC101183]|uniref:amidase n=1 Tax=Kitasatospora sp. NPDC101183 TaxID=3364100 RepID=UPI003812C0A2